MDSGVRQVRRRCPALAFAHVLLWGHSSAGIARTVRPRSEERIRPADGILWSRMIGQRVSLAPRRAPR